MRKLLLLGLVGCWGSSSPKPASPPPAPAPAAGASTGGATYGGDAYGGEAYGGDSYGALAPPAGGPAAGNPVPPTITVGTPAGGGGIDRDVIRRHIQRERAAILRCYEQELARSPTLAGTVTARFVISGSGNVTQSSGSGLPPVDTCVARVILSIVFPAPTGGGVVTVSYPFIFRP